MGFKGFVKRKHLGVIVKNTSFKNLTTMKVGGTIKCFFCPNDVNSLIKALKYISSKKLEYFVLGNGSNVVASNKKYKGIVISLKKMPSFLEINDNTVRVSSNYSVTRLANNLALDKYKNLEFLSSIPGTVGGAIYMNAGSYKMEIADNFLSCLVMEENGRIIKLFKKDLKFDYRKSILQTKKLICLEATFAIAPTNENLIEKINDWKNSRANSQPLDKPSSGSVFKNPEHYKACELIDHINYRGKKYGGAMFSEKHANFIINTGNATGEDIKSLVYLAKKDVYKKLRTALEVEIVFFNF